MISAVGRQGRGEVIGEGCSLRHEGTGRISMLQSPGLRKRWTTTFLDGDRQALLASGTRRKPNSGDGNTRNPRGRRPCPAATCIFYVACSAAAARHPADMTLAHGVGPVSSIWAGHAPRFDQGGSIGTRRTPFLTRPRSGTRAAHPPTLPTFPSVDRE